MNPYALEMALQKQAHYREVAEQERIANECKKELRHAKKTETLKNRPPRIPGFFARWVKQPE
jgi:hypothetical protein